MIIRLPNPTKSWVLGKKLLPASTIAKQMPANHQLNYCTCWKTHTFDWHPIMCETQVHVLDWKAVSIECTAVHDIDLYIYGHGSHIHVRLC